MYLQERCVQVFDGGDLRERGHMEDLGVGERKILIWVSKQWDGTVDTIG